MLNFTSRRNISVAKTNTAEFHPSLRVESFVLSKLTQLFLGWLSHSLVKTVSAEVQAISVKINHQKSTHGTITFRILFEIFDCNPFL